MLNEFVYCPRLFFYEWVDGVFEHSADTVEGAVRHETRGREGGRAAAGGSGRRRRDPLAVGHPFERTTPADREDRSRGGERRPGEPRRLQEAGGRPRATQGLRVWPAGSGAGVRPGARAARQRLPLRRGHRLLRGDEAAGQGAHRRGTDPGHRGGHRRGAACRRGRPHPAAARRQPQVPPVLAGVHLPPRRDARHRAGPRGNRAGAPARPCSSRKPMADTAALRAAVRHRPGATSRPGARRSPPAVRHRPRPLHREVRRGAAGPRRQARGAGGAPARDVPGERVRQRAA